MPPGSGPRCRAARAPAGDARRPALAGAGAAVLRARAARVQVGEPAFVD